MYKYLLESQGIEEQVEAKVCRAPEPPCSCDPFQEVCSKCEDTTFWDEDETEEVFCDLCGEYPEDCECEDDCDTTTYTEAEFDEAVKKALEEGWHKGYSEASDQLKQGVYREARKEGFDEGSQSGYMKGYRQALEDVRVKPAVISTNTVLIDGDNTRVIGTHNPTYIAKESLIESPKEKLKTFIDALRTGNNVQNEPEPKESQDSAVDRLLNRYGNK